MGTEVSRTESGISKQESETSPRESQIHRSIIPEQKMPHRKKAGEKILKEPNPEKHQAEISRPSAQRETTVLRSGSSSTGLQPDPRQRILPKVQSATFEPSLLRSPTPFHPFTTLVAPHTHLPVSRVDFLFKNGNLQFHYCCGAGD